MLEEDPFLLYSALERFLGTNRCVFVELRRTKLGVQKWCLHVLSPPKNSGALDMVGFDTENGAMK